MTKRVFTLNWIQGGGIAAREVAHLPARQEDDVAAEVERLPERHLAERLASSAMLVVMAKSTRTWNRTAASTSARGTLHSGRRPGSGMSKR